MKPAEQGFEGFSFGKDEAALAALVRHGFEAVGGPSARVTDAIAAEARRAAGRGSFRRFGIRPRVLTAAAAVAVAAFALYFNQAAPDDRRAKTTVTGLSAESAHGLAVLLLDIQGLNEESFFMTEEAEPLWL